MSIMKRIIIVSLFVILTFGCSTTKKEEQAPNIIYFLADDLGYGELGVHRII